MSNSLFPSLPGLAFPVTKTPMWKTTTQEAQSGKEVRIGKWSFPRWKYSLPFEFLRDRADPKDELWELLGFFNQHRGSHESWLFEDPDDKSVTAQSFGTGNGARTVFQLLRTKGGFTEPVRGNPTSGDGVPAIYKNGVLQTISTHYTIANGIVTFTSAPANGVALTWTGGYYWRCRFSDDYVDVSKFAKDLWEAQKVEFVSVK